MKGSLILFGFASLLLLACTSASNAARSSILIIYGAGTLAVPFRQLDVLFDEQHPVVAEQPEFGGGVMLARQGNCSPGSHSGRRVSTSRLSNFPASTSPSQLPPPFPQTAPVPRRAAANDGIGWCRVRMRSC